MDEGRPRAADRSDGWAVFGFALFKASTTRFFWYARYHHIVLDAFGMWLVARRVAEVYTALCAGESSRGDAFGPLSGLLNEDAAYRASAQLDEDRHYWRDALAARPEPGSLTLSSRPSSKPGDFLRATAYVPSSCELALRTLAARSRTTLARVMTAATAVFLHRLSGADDAMIGVPVAARSADARRIPGMVSNVLPLRLALQHAMTVADVVEQTSRRLRSDLQHQRYQLADLRHDVGGEVRRPDLVRGEHQRDAVRLRISLCRP